MQAAPTNIPEDLQVVIEHLEGQRKVRSPFWWCWACATAVNKHSAVCHMSVWFTTALPHDNPDATLSLRHKRETEHETDCWLCDFGK
jgi:hypothetical protein